ncbi:MAG: hypothetical protein PWQ96_1284 [Clostridia bacterium]|nr:hypothetical protein [Clostridia bacterium]
MQQEHEELEKHVQIVTVNVSKFEKSLQDVQDLVEVLEISSPVLLDKNGDVFRKYLLRGIPATFLIDSEGKIISKKLGLIGPEFLQEVKKIK